MTGCIVTDTAKRFGMSAKDLFHKVGVAKELTEATMDSRYERWFKYGETPTYVQDWCLDLWAQKGEADVSSGSYRARAG